MGNTSSGPLILKCMQIAVRENSLIQNLTSFWTQTRAKSRGDNLQNGVSKQETMLGIKECLATC